MERGRGGGGAPAALAAAEERRGREAAEDEESDGSSGGGLELSLRLRTGQDDHDDGGGAPAADAAGSRRKRNMTIFYNGRVCAVDVTEVQARAIISMASEEGRAADHRQQGSDSGSGGGGAAAMARRCARDGLVRPVPVPAAASPAAASPRQGLGTPVMMDQAVAGLSMKRSLQRFLQKRQARTAAAVEPPYAGGGWQAQVMRH
ncbi:hypothetical protein BS78_02G035800 [Paspalum vaginatum]|nr:hypothetical protein BS78_02G035800 [Paspalum vaginatum]